MIRITRFATVADLAEIEVQPFADAAGDLIPDGFDAAEVATRLIDAGQYEWRAEDLSTAGYYRVDDDEAWQEVFNGYVKELEIAARKEALEGAGDFALGGGTLDEVAKEWESFSADSVRRWLAARCFRADAARRLAELGWTPEDASEITSEGAGGYSDTVGYKVANGDLTVGPRR